MSLSAMSRPSCLHAAAVSAFTLWHMSTGVPTGSAFSDAEGTYIKEETDMKYDPELTALLAQPWLPNHPM